jgi:hypothetical protein
VFVPFPSVVLSTDLSAGRKVSRQGARRGVRAGGLPDPPGWRFLWPVAWRQPAQDGNLDFALRRAPEEIICLGILAWRGTSPPRSAGGAEAHVVVAVGGPIIVAVGGAGIVGVVVERAATQNAVRSPPCGRDVQTTASPAVVGYRPGGRGLSSWPGGDGPRRSRSGSRRNGVADHAGGGENARRCP